MLAIVLSGGGAKGAYEAGVWKALRKLKVKYSIVTGTSIGALNGMMMTQNEFYKCLRFWKNISFEQLYDDFEYKKHDTLQIYKNYLDKMIDGGIDTHKIEKIINSHFKSHKIYNSKISFGVVSYNVTDKKPAYSTNRNTRPNRLKQYILASATCYPAFKPTKIGTDTYIDGGFYDNLPLNLALELGADEIIAVDLKAIGFKKSIKSKEIPVTYITPKAKLDSFLMFESHSTRKMINLGYNDTMKVFGKYEGDVYTFKKGTIRHLYHKYRNKMVKISNEYEDLSKKIKKESMLNIIEDTLEIFEIAVDKVYTSISYNETLKNKIDEIEDINLNELNIEELKKVFDKKAIVKYLYTKIKNHGKINNIILNLFQKEYLAAVYLVAIRS